jgi:hypothetical protein
VEELDNEDKEVEEEIMIIKSQLKEKTMMATELKKTINMMSVRNPQFNTGGGKNDKLENNDVVSDNEEYDDDFADPDSHE